MTPQYLEQLWKRLNKTPPAWDAIYETFQALQRLHEINQDYKKVMEINEKFIFEKGVEMGILHKEYDKMKKQRDELLDK